MHGQTLHLEDTSFVDMLGLFFNQRALSKIHSEKRGFGKSFLTNGVEIIFRMAPEGYNETKDEQQQAGLEKRERNRELVAAGEEPEPPAERAEKQARRGATQPRKTFGQLFRVAAWIKGGFMEVAS